MPTHYKTVATVRLAVRTEVTTIFKPNLLTMLIFDKRYLGYVQSILRGKTDAQHKPTPQSWTYRKRAAALAREADACHYVDEQVRLVKDALNWIQLAENEEYMALNAPLANDN